MKCLMFLCLVGNIWSVQLVPCALYINQSCFIVLPTNRRICLLEPSAWPVCFVYQQTMCHIVDKWKNLSSALNENECHTLGITDNPCKI